MQEYAGQPIENVPEEYREKIATLRQYGLEPEKPIYEQVIEFIEEHGRIVNSAFYEKGENGKRKQLTRDQMTEEQKKEAKLCKRWYISDEYKILQEYAGQPIENVPEEYREKIATLRDHGLEPKKTTYEQVIEFIEANGRIMKAAFSEKGENGKRKNLTVDQMTEEQKEEVNLYNRWIYSDEYKILQEYVGKPIENVPEEYREKIATLRQYGIEPKPKRNRTAKEIVEASISSLTDQENADRAYTELQELVKQREQKRGEDIGEQP